MPDTIVEVAVGQEPWFKETSLGLVLQACGLSKTRADVGAAIECSEEFLSATTPREQWCIVRNRL